MSSVPPLTPAATPSKPNSNFHEQTLTLTNHNAPLPRLRPIYSSPPSPSTFISPDLQFQVHPEIEIKTKAEIESEIETKQGIEYTPVPNNNSTPRENYTRRPARRNARPRVSDGVAC